MRDWKTTTFGLISAFFAFVLFKPVYFPPVLVDLAAFALAGGLAGLGITAQQVSKGSGAASATASEPERKSQGPDSAAPEK